MMAGFTDCSSGVGVPSSVVHRALERRERMRHRELQHQRYESEAVGWARRASERLLKCLKAGRLRAGTSELGSLESLPQDRFVESRSELADVFVVFELRPGLAGRLRSITSRAWMTDPDFVEAVGEGLRAAVWQHGLRLRFHPHWVQRFVPSGTGGYYQIVGFQLLARVLRNPGGG